MYVNIQGSCVFGAEARFLKSDSMSVQEGTLRNVTVVLDGSMKKCPLGTETSIVVNSSRFV